MKFEGLTMNQLAEKNAELQTQLTQMAAENAALKSAIKGAAEEMEAHHDDDGLFSYDADGEPMDALLRLCDAQATVSDINLETSTTDAVIAGIRAEGVEKALRDLLSWMNRDMDIDSLETKWDVSSAVIEYINHQQNAASPDADGWTEWNGGECPVPGDTRVEVKFINEKTKNLQFEKERADFGCGSITELPAISSPFASVGAKNNEH